MIQMSYCYKSEGKLIVVHKQQAYAIERSNNINEVAQFHKKDLQVCIKPAQVTLFKEIYGIMKLSAKLYLIVVSQSQQVGQISDNIIFKATRFDYISIGQEQQYQPLLKPLRDSFDILDLYYSEYDLTQRLQFSHVYPTYYPYSFFCNYKHTLHHNNFPQHLLTKFIFGFAQTKTVNAGGVVYNLTLISRGNFNSAGRRWLRRGLNDHGHPANNFQTQFILEVQTQDKHSVYSMLQTRGSIPLLWSQTLNFSLTAPFGISGDQLRTKQQLRDYVEQCQKIYNKMLILSLIDKSGREGVLGQHFEGCFRDMNKPNINCVWFDYHNEYKQYKQGCFNRLTQLIRHDLSDFGYFKMQKHPNDYSYVVIKQQTGIVRTNCIDCIDRSNYIQSLIAKLALLAFIDDHQEKEPLLYFPLEQSPIKQLQQVFKKLWKNNAAAIAYQLTGASAMKMDYYQNGKRSVFGPLRDLGVGTKRYYFGIFVDYYYQNCLDLHFGKLNIQDQNLNLKGGWIKSVGLIASITAIAGLSYGAFHVAKSQFQNQVKKISYGITASFLTTLAGLITIKTNSEYFIPKPIIRQEYI